MKKIISLALTLALLCVPVSAANQHGPEAGGTETSQYAAGMDRLAAEMERMIAEWGRLAAQGGWPTAQAVQPVAGSGLPALQGGENSVTMEDLKLFQERIDAVYGPGYAEGEMVLSCVKDAAVLCGLSWSSEENGAICIGKLKDRPGYIVTLGGTEPLNTEENVGIREDILAGFHQDNEYQKNATKAILDTIPAGEDIYIYGYSLGGMVMQQVLADQSVWGSYHIRSAVAFGSPVTALLRQKIVFLEDSSDVVPSLSAMSMLIPDLCRAYDSHLVRDGGYKTPVGAHVLSYVDSPVWNDVDLLGQPGGNVTLTVDMEQFWAFKG